jgi:hypothetical protein
MLGSSILARVRRGRDVLDLHLLRGCPVTIPRVRTTLDRIPLPFLALGWVWAAPVTVAVFVVCLLTGGSAAWRTLRWRDRFAELVPGGLPAAVFRATRTAGASWGTLVLFRSATQQRNPDLRQHEARHVCWWLLLGPLFLPAYLALGCWAVATGRRFYRDNPMEVDARAAEKEPNEEVR